MELDTEQDPEARKQILRTILELKKDQLEVVRLENAQKAREQRNMRDYLERHHPNS